MKSEIIILAASLALSSQAAVPLRWTVETSRLQPVVFYAVRGETLSLEASFQSYGKPLQTTNLTAFLCWQTNGMENAWWMTNAVTTATVARVLFTPEMDPGATTVNAFIGLSDSANQPTNLTTQQPSLSYRAACTIRFRHGPGAVPNVIEQPPRVLDLAHTVVINAPWPTQEDFAATTTVMRAELKDYVDEQIESAGIVTPQSVTNISSSVTSNIVTKSYVEGLGISGGGVDPNAVKSLIDNEIGGTNAVKAAVADVATIKADYTTHAESTNAANAAITNAVTSGYLCTVENAQTMTNTRLPASDSMSDYGHYAITNSLDISGVIYIMMEIDTHLYCRTWDCFYNVESQESIPDYLSSLAWHPSNASLSSYGITNGIPSVDGFINAQTATNIVKDATNNLQKVAHSGSYNDLEDKPTAQSLGAASSSEVIGMQSSMSTLNNGYTRLYNFVTGATNANFSATNYPPTAAEAATRRHYKPEPGMDFSTVPASLQLNEYRDGAWRTVMDTRDWTVWYYKFKEQQLTNDIARLKAENASLSNRLDNAQAWANHTANGVENPMTDTLVVDRPNMWLMAGYEWQKCVSGSNQCFVLRAKNVALSGGANTNGFLEICDAFGKPYMRVNKSAETFADPVFSDIYFDNDDGAWYVVFGNTTKPTTGGANAEIVGNWTGKCILYAEDDPECPATITWPESADSHAGHWIMKAVPKPVDGVVPTRMFFGAEIKVAGKDYVEYIKEASFGAGIRVGNNVYEAVESGNTLIWTKRSE